MKFYPGTKREIYFDRTRLRGYTSAQNVVSAQPGDGAKILRLRLPSFDVTEHVHAALFYRKQSAQLKKAWSNAADRAAMRTFGRKFEFHDYRISGIGREEFSEKDKNILRRLAHESGEVSDFAWAHWRAAGKRGPLPQSNPDIHIDIGSHNARGGKSVRTNPTGKFHVETKMHRAGFWEHDPQNVFPTFKAALRFAREAQHQGFTPA